MDKFKLNYVGLAIALVLTGVLIYLFVDITDNPGYAVATPLLMLCPLLFLMAVTKPEAPRATVNAKIMSALAAILLLLTGILACSFDFKAPLYVALVTVFFLVWLGVTYSLVFNTRG
mgnify:CR=1 FL=1